MKAEEEEEVEEKREERGKEAENCHYSKSKIALNYTPHPFPALAATCTPLLPSTSMERNIARIRGHYIALFHLPLL